METVEEIPKIGVNLLYTKIPNIAQKYAKALN